jgi:hypothetical protein
MQKMPGRLGVETIAQRVQILTIARQGPGKTSEAFQEAFITNGKRGRPPMYMGLFTVTSTKEGNLRSDKIPGSSAEIDVALLTGGQYRAYAFGLAWSSPAEVVTPHEELDRVDA